jgi:hypothetical protein
LGRTAIKNVGKIISGIIEDPIVPGDTVIIEDKYISKVGYEKECQIDEADRVIDANGTTLCPGLIADPLGRESEILTESVVMAVGMSPNRKLFEELQKGNISVSAVGDCVEPRQIMDAIHEGYLTAFFV